MSAMIQPGPEARVPMEAKAGQVRQLTARLLDAQEGERRRIARELHDDFKQRLACLGLELAALAAESPEMGIAAEAAHERIGRLVERVAELNSDLGRIASRLHPAALERFGLARVIAAMASETEALRGIPVRVHLQDGDLALPPDMALATYRVAQEAIENACRHAQATEVRLTLTHGPHELRLTVADDGVGFDPHRLELASRDPNPLSGGLGLISMRERATLLGGALSVLSTPGAGTRIELTLPSPLLTGE